MTSKHQPHGRNKTAADAADVIIVPRRSRQVNPLPELALLVVNHSEADLAVSLALADGACRNPFFHWQLVVDRQQRYCLAGPALGAPAAGLLMEQLLVHGVNRFLLVSCCGSLDPASEIGDLVVPVATVTDTNLSRWYTDRDVLATDASLQRGLSAFVSRQGLATASGVIWSTDAPYREHRSELLALRHHYGVGFVDMEFSSLCAIATYRGVSLASLFVVSDYLWTKAWRPGFTSSRFRHRCKTILSACIGHGTEVFRSE
ncbi:phosphorylase family protein [Desulfofustis limnaeus]|jgi:purine-nucleoside phosphorylase|uniref:Nucleoside phosphorylase domain-containing protein n=1 Tax=Desulfofustis limnaeus TaxID=2740163 RepID=A0ABM7W4C0_9BACT|nr:hypothetical protein [Desulfofustis limnaeus]MDX9893820.1 hypothetical protein [Desulfofustis sp.]BDD85770.1 hypothetical protein DPPLL_01350 [Desulfofustis limnaeus]